MSKVIPINSSDGLAPRIQQGDEDEAGAIVTGKPKCVCILAASTEGDLCRRIAPDRMRFWARLIGYMPTELRSAFEAELATIPRADGSFSDPGHNV
jgi:hypothetical protein